MSALFAAIIIARIENRWIRLRLQTGKTRLLIQLVPSSSLTNWGKRWSCQSWQQQGSGRSPSLTMAAPNRAGGFLWKGVALSHLAILLCLRCQWRRVEVEPVSLCRQLKATEALAEALWWYSPSSSCAPTVTVLFSRSVCGVYEYNFDDENN